MRSRGLLAVSAIAILTVAGCTGADEEPPGGNPSWDQSSATVKVEERDLTSVLALNATVVASPEFSITAPQAGRFQANHGLTGVLRAGTEIGSIDTGKKVVAVTLPVEATLREFSATNQANVPAGLPLAAFKASGFGIRAQVPDALLYRMLDVAGEARFQIENGPGPTTCPLLGGPSAGGGGEVVSVVCGASEGMKLFPGLAAILAVNTGEARGVPALPIEAVAGTADQGRVAVRVGSGRFEERDVRLGISDGSYVQIVKGLAVGDEVRKHAPGLPTSRQR